MLNRFSRSVKVALDRVGKPTTVLRGSSSTQNGYGKDSGEWTNPTTVGTWTAFRSYSYRSDRPEQQYDVGGERDEDTPVFLLPADADVQNGDRLKHDGVTYEVTSDPVVYDTHYECRTQKVN